MFCRYKIIVSLLFCLLISLGWGCVDGEEVELWGQCYNIEETTSLNLSYNQLTGEIPPEIGNLTNLTYLNLESNQLTGGIPEEIGNLINLTYLNLSYNQLTGGIPEEIGNLTNLTSLWLFYNQLTGEIPLEIGNLMNLIRLDLGGNNITGSIPIELMSLTDLTYLGLWETQLTGEIPSEIGNLINLELLWLYENNFVNDIPNEIGNLINLTVLGLNDNHLSGNIPESICDLNNLNWLGEWGNYSYSYLYNNELCPPYPECLSDEDIGYQDTLECDELSNSDHIIEYSLNKPYPNPFNPTTTISFSVPNYDFISIKVYDISGGLVSTLVEDHFNQGTHSITWDGTDFPSGQYLVKMKSGSFSKTQIISLIK